MVSSTSLDSFNACVSICWESLLIRRLIWGRVFTHFCRKSGSSPGYGLFRVVFAFYMSDPLKKLCITKLDGVGPVDNRPSTE